MNKKIINKISIVVFAVVSLVLLFSAVRSIFLSFMAYKPYSFTSIGFTHFKRLFENTYFSRMVTNTIVINLLSTVIGVIYVFLASAAISSFNNKMCKSIIAFLFVIPALLPSEIQVALVYKLFTGNIPDNMILLMTAIVSGLRYASIVILFAVFMEGMPLNVAVKCSLVFVGIKLITFFVTDFSIVFSIQSQDAFATLSTYPHSLFIGNASAKGDVNLFEYASAIEVVKMVFQLLPAVLGVVIIRLQLKNDISLNNKINLKPTLVTVIVPVAILVAAFLCYNRNISSLGRINQIYQSSVVYAILSVIMVYFSAIAVANIIRQFQSFGCITVCILLCVSDFIMPYYGLRDTLGSSALGATIINLRMVPMLAIAIAAVNTQIKWKKVRLAVFLAAFGLLFSWFWSDWFAPLSVRCFNISAMAKEYYDTVNGHIETTTFRVPMLTYKLVPLVVSGLCIFASGLIMDKNADE